MTKYMDALHAARDMTDTLQAEYQAMQGYGATGLRGRLSYMSSVDCLRELRKEQTEILRLRRLIAAFKAGVEPEFSHICEKLEIPFTPGDTRG